MRKTSDEQLMKELVSGKRESFAPLYDRYKTPVMSFALNYFSDKSLAEEALQESFLKVFRFQKSFREDSSFKTWMWSIVRNTCVDLLRKKRKIAGEMLLAFEDQSFDEFASPDFNDPELKLIQESDVKDIQRAMKSLTQEQRELLLMRVFSELSYEEIAHQSGLKLATVKTHIFRARKKLNGVLEGRGNGR